MFPYISGRPSFHLRDVFSISDKQESVFPLYQKRCYFFFSARYALASGVEALGISTDDTVLIPSYNCGVEIDPILRLGIRPVFYKIGKDLLVDLDDLLNKITSRVKAILVTHFLGFPQPIDQIKKICVERNLFLIEDCAHAFLSANNEHHLGSYGDIAIFSLLKTLPVPNGGILILNNDSLSCRTPSVKPSLFSTFFYAAELLKYKTWSTNHSIKVNLIKFLYGGFYISLSSIRFLLAGLRKYIHPKGLYLVRPDSYFFVENLCSWGISDLSKRIINKTDFEEVKNNRRRNFEYLLNHFHKNERGILPFTRLPPGVCPLFFPIILESAEQREMLYRTLKRRGVITHPWWDRFHPEVPWDEFPDAVYLKQRLFGLPIHKDLTYEHLDQVIIEFEKAYLSI
jgi:dTDP-4-amino-4,6-dideoxygalactose transaminase